MFNPRSLFIFAVFYPGPNWVSVGIFSQLAAMIGIDNRNRIRFIDLFF